MDYSMAPHRHTGFMNRTAATRHTRTATWPLGLLLLLLATSACGFQAATPKGFVELDEKHSPYDYRAVNADGVVLAVRSIRHEPRGDLAFWTKAIQTQMRQRGGYALLGSADVKSADGIPGKKLEFGHDEQSAPHVYTITVFVTEKRIFVLEAGGKKELMEKEAASVDFSIQNFRTHG